MDVPSPLKKSEIAVRNVKEHVKTTGTKNKEMYKTTKGENEKQTIEKSLNCHLEKVKTPIKNLTRPSIEVGPELQ